MHFDYALFGGGDFAIEIATYIKDAHVARGDSDWKIGDIVSPSLPRIEDFERLLGYRPRFHNDIGSLGSVDAKSFVICMGDPAARHRVACEIERAGGRFATVVHPSAYVAATAKVKDGTIVCPLAFVGPFATVGRNSALNVGAIVGHDASLGDCTVLSPGANINGHGRTGVAAFLGAGAIINPKIELGQYSKLAAGSVLNKTVGDGFLMHGNPATGRQMIRVP